MKYVSIDLETTGLNPDKCQIIEIAAIVDDTENPLPFDRCPKISYYVQHDQIYGEPYALNMNVEILEALSDKYLDKSRKIHNDVITSTLHTFLGSHLGNRWTAAGKNFANFDMRFLRNLPGQDLLRFSHRTIDPSMWFLEIEDEKLPDLQTCLDRAGILTSVQHRALNDAWAVVQLVREGLRRQRNWLLTRLDSE